MGIERLIRNLCPRRFVCGTIRSWGRRRGWLKGRIWSCQKIEGERAIGNKVKAIKKISNIKDNNNKSTFYKKTLQSTNRETTKYSSTKSKGYTTQKDSNYSTVRIIIIQIVANNCRQPRTWNNYNKYAQDVSYLLLSK